MQASNGDRPARAAALIALVLGLLVAVVGGAAPATAAPVRPSVSKVNPLKYRTYQQGPYSQYRFSSPSGNLRCSIAQYEDSSPWGCFAMKHAWADPKLPNIYGQSCAAYGSGRLKGAMFASSSVSGFYVTCKSTYPDAKAKGKKLALGRSITVNHVTCVSLRLHGKEAMRCTVQEKATLTVSRSRMTFRQPKQWNP